MPITRKKNKTHNFSTFKNELLESSHSEVIENLKPEKNQNQLNDNEPIDFQNDDRQLVIKTFQTKFFPFLNQFSKKLNYIKENKIPSSKESLSGSQSSDKSQKGEQSQFSKIQISENSQKSIRKGRNSKNKISRQSIQIIEANLQNGKFHGQAKLILKNGGIFTGQTKNGELKHGKVIYQSGLQYEGEFENNVFNGKSQIRLSNGTILKIQWFQGIPAPHGQIIYSNGQSYIGGIKKFKKHGIGQLKLTSGKKYVGEFQKGQICGKGTYYDSDTRIIADGMWYNGKFLGSAEISPSIKTMTSSDNS